jgi:hypothetical protein
MFSTVLFIISMCFYISGCGNSGEANSVQVNDIEQNASLSLEVRYISWSATSDSYDSESDNGYGYRYIFFKPDEVVFVVLDAWDTSYNNGLAKRIDENIRTKLKPALDQARNLKIPVIHLPHLYGSPYGYKIHPLCEPLPGEIVIDGLNEKTELDSYLIDHGIRYLFYTGYASNMCLLNRPTGIMEMINLGYSVVFIRDASLANEIPSVFPDGMVHSIITSIYESYGTSISVDDFLSLK